MASWVDTPRCCGGVVAGRASRAHLVLVFYVAMMKRFWSKTEPEPNSGCLLWAGAIGKGGYGNFWTGEQVGYAHRFAYELANGPIPHGSHVLHHCDVRNCVNADHLFVGTHADNMRDMSDRLRVPHAKLTPAQVAEIRNQYPGASLRALGRRFGVSHNAIWKVVKGRRFTSP
jgi:hypothetical protein